MVKRRIFSGVQPSGRLHLGNYLGALRQWVKLHQEYESIFCVVDLHAITTPRDPRALREGILDAAAWLVAVGIDPEKAAIFVQSDNPDHPYLSWILNNFTSVGELNRMTQFKEKRQQREFVSVGLYDYPVLMAADILLYDTDLVPVGEDQKQHVEITRDIAARFNSRYRREIFKLPSYLLPPAGKRVMSLQDPTRKMSKSVADPLGTISLDDEPEEIRRKVMAAVTDSGDEVRIAPEKKAVSNLVNIFVALSSKTEEDLDAEYSGRGYQRFKEDLAEVIVQELSPLQERYRDIRGSSRLKEILQEGLMKVRQLSSAKVSLVREIVGLGMQD